MTQETQGPYIYNNEATLDRVLETPDWNLDLVASCSASTAILLSERVQEQGVGWIYPVHTGTSRDIFFGGLDSQSGSSGRLVFKRSRFDSTKRGASDPKSPHDEIERNKQLDEMLKDVGADIMTNRAAIGKQISMKAERAIGIVNDKKNNEFYTIFEHVTGYSRGELLQYVDPPMEGNLSFVQNEWDLYCELMDVLDQVRQASAKKGINISDLNIHQLLYKVCSKPDSLDIVFTDTE